MSRRSCWPGCMAKTPPHRRKPPSGGLVTGADAAAVDAVIGTWLAGQAAAREKAARGGEGESPEVVAIAVDGKTVRKATDAEGNQVHLLAAATHDDALVLGQVEVGAKTNEIPMFAPLLDTLADIGVDRVPTHYRPLRTDGPDPGAAARRPHRSALRRSLLSRADPRPAPRHRLPVTAQSRSAIDAGLRLAAGLGALGVALGSHIVVASRTWSWVLP